MTDATAETFPEAPPRVELAPGLAGRIAEAGAGGAGNEGPGETVFWVHGYTIDSSLWAEIWGHLPGWRHVGVDLPGHGGSAPIDGETTLRDLGERLAEAALAQGARHVVGLSLGALVALEVALARPAAFETLTLGAPAIAGGPADPSVGQRYQEMARLWWQSGGDRQAMRRLWMTSPPDLFKGAEDRPALWDRLVAVIDGYGWDEFHGPGVARLAAAGQSVEALPDLGCRVMTLIGEREFPAFRDTARRIATTTGGTVAELPDAGHLCMLEAPAAGAAAIAGHLGAEAN
jgi:pimeloyl-ACP methyl ester carboxylesterase